MKTRELSKLPPLIKSQSNKLLTSESRQKVRAGATLFINSSLIE